MIRGRRRAVTFATLVVFAFAAALVTSGGVVLADPAPTLTVTPSTGLVHQQVVTVTGTGYTPGETVLLAQCEGAADACDGGTIEFIAADGTGAISTSVTARRTLRTNHNLAFDCLAAPGACRIVVAHLVGPTGVTLASAAIDFDPLAPAPALPTITVDPASGLADGQLVHVHASGFTAGEQVQVIECRSGTLSLRPCSGSTGLNADGSGAVDVVYLARKLLGIAFQPSGFGGPALDPPFDCSAAGAECALFVTAVADPVRTNWVPLSFDPAAPVAPSGLSVYPLTGIRDGEVVTVAGQRASQEQIFVAICRAGVDVPGPPTGPCAFVGGRNADAQGTVHFEFPLPWISHQLDGHPLDCTPPAPCEVLLLSSSTPSLVLDRFPVSFTDERASVPRFTG